MAATGGPAGPTMAAIGSLPLTTDGPPLKSCKSLVHETCGSSCLHGQYGAQIINNNHIIELTRSVYNSVDQNQANPGLQIVASPCSLAAYLHGFDQYP